MRPILVAAVCSAGAAFLLVLGEVALLGPTHHVGGSTNSSGLGTKSSGQASSSESLVRGPNGIEEMAAGGPTTTEDQSTAEAAPNGGQGQSSDTGLVQRTLSNAGVPITVGPLGR